MYSLKSKNRPSSDQTAAGEGGAVGVEGGEGGGCGGGSGGVQKSVYRRRRVFNNQPIFMFQHWSSAAAGESLEETDVSGVR